MFQFFPFNSVGGRLRAAGSFAEKETRASIFHFLPRIFKYRVIQSLQSHSEWYRVIQTGTEPFRVVHLHSEWYSANQSGTEAVRVSGIQSFSVFVQSFSSPKPSLVPGNNHHSFFLFSDFRIPRSSGDRHAETRTSGGPRCREGWGWMENLARVGTGLPPS